MFYFLDGIAEVWNRLLIQLGPFLLWGLQHQSQVYPSCVCSRWHAGDSGYPAGTESTSSNGVQCRDWWNGKVRKISPSIYN